MTEQEIIDQLRAFLREEGISFFRQVKEEFGTVLAVLPVSHELNHDGIPHPIHFREGMQIRNFLRRITNNEWDFDRYENGWVQIVEDTLIG
jgi:hypothetical protein